MGAYDSIYARCNCDWPEDERCKALPDDQTRWFNHLLWLESVRQKSSVLPQRCDAAYWAKRLGATIERVEEMIQAMATEDLLAWTEFGELVIFGTRKNHQKLAWKQEEPEETINPFRKTSGWRFLRLSGDSSGYPVKQAGYPVKSPTVESRVEKSREEESRVEIPPIGGDTTPPPIETDPLEDYPELKEAYPKIRDLIVQAHPRVKLPDMGSKAELKDRKVLADLVRLDGHTHVEVVKVTNWVLTEEKPSASGFCWRDQFQSFGGLRNKKSGDTMTKFAKMCAAHDRGNRKPDVPQYRSANSVIDVRGVPDYRLQSYPVDEHARKLRADYPDEPWRVQAYKNADFEKAFEGIGYPEGFVLPPRRPE